MTENHFQKCDSGELVSREFTVTGTLVLTVTPLKSSKKASPTVKAKTKSEPPRPEPFPSGDPKMIRVSSAGKRRGVNRQAIYYRILQGHLQTFERDGILFVKEEDVDALKFRNKR